MLVGLLKDKAAASRLHASEQVKQAATTATLTSPSPVIGRQLFTGEVPLRNGGPPCAACHRAAGAGGTIGPDLTTVATQLGHTALVSGIQQAGYKIMSAAFRRHPITPQEAVHLAAYLEALSANGREAPDVSGLVTVAGLLAALLLFAAIPFYYRGRTTGVRARLLRNRH